MSQVDSSLHILKSVNHLVPVSLKLNKYDDSHTEPKDYYCFFFFLNVLPLTFKSVLCNSQLWTSYQGISSSMFPLPELVSIDLSLELVFK